MESFGADTSKQSVKVFSGTIHESFLSGEFPGIQYILNMNWKQKWRGTRLLNYCCGFQAESGANQPLTFVDLAGAPSGFSHYVYWKKQHLAKVGVA